MGSKAIRNRKMSKNGVNKKLKHAIIQKGVKQFRVAKDTGIHFTRLSQIINGWTRPNAREMETLAEYFDKPIRELF
jgi:transcriptional regulator with XRE-family HTH domain